MKSPNHTILFMSILLGASAAACGGGAEGANPPVAAAPAPQAVGAMTILLRPSRSADVNAAVQSALIGAGYTLVVDPRAPHDAEGQLVVTETEVPSMFQVTVGGVRQRNLRGNVSLALQSGGQIIDHVTTQFEAKSTEITPDKVGGLVTALGNSPRVQKFAEGRAVVNEERAAQVQQRADDDKAQQANEEAAWTATIGDCRAPKDAHSCDALKAWFATENQRMSGRGPQPTSAAEFQQRKQRYREAQGVLDAAAPTIKTFADSEAWSRAEVPRCQAATTFEDCAALHAYMDRFPAGAHIDEAKSALDVGNQRLAAKAAEADREAAVRDRAAAGRAHQNSCRAKCSDETCIAYTDETKKAACVAQCTAGCS